MEQQWLWGQAVGRTAMYYPAVSHGAMYQQHTESSPAAPWSLPTGKKGTDLLHADFPVIDDFFF